MSDKHYNLQINAAGQILLPLTEKELIMLNDAITWYSNCFYEEKIADNLLHIFTIGDKLEYALKQLKHDDV